MTLKNLHIYIHAFLFDSEKEKLKMQLKFEILNEWPSQNAFNEWQMRQQTETWSYTQTRSSICIQCPQSAVNERNHLMQTRYARCNNENCKRNGIKQCERHYKFQKCLLLNKIVGFVKGVHSVETKLESNNALIGTKAVAKIKQELMVPQVNIGKIVFFIPRKFLKFKHNVLN